MNVRRKPAFGVFGHYGNENMGDEAIVAAVIEEIRGRYPQSLIFGFSIVPQDTEARHQIKSYPIRRVRPAPVMVSAQINDYASEKPGHTGGGMRERIKQVPMVYPLLRFAALMIRGLGSIVAEVKFLRESYRNIKKVDVLFVAGSGQLTDESGIWGFPYTLYKWSVLAKWSGCKLAFIGVGAGPLEHGLSRWFVRQALRRAIFRSYRDESSLRLIRTIGAGEGDMICPDLAWGKKVAVRSTDKSSGSALRVGVNPMAYHDPRYWPNAKAERFNEYIHKLTDMFIWIAQQGHTVALFPTQLRADVLIIRELASALDKVCPPDIRRRIETVEITGLDSQLEMMSRCDLIIATRFHGVLMSYLVGKPTIGISYHPKINDLMATMGHAECALAIDPLNVEVLKRTFTRLALGLGESQQIVLAGRAEQLRQLEQMYDRAFVALMA
jgi:polysaccharide pyruvyl transferase WcaK-like protein